MMRVWQKRLLFNRPAERIVITESGEITLDAQLYIITAVGGGSSGAGAFSALNANAYVCGVQGGVGGTLKVGVRVPVQTTLKITIGAGGQSVGFTNNQNPFYGNAGGDTIIEGLISGTLIAGGATAGGVQRTGTAFTRWPGTQGVNTIGDVVKIFEDNKNQITGGSYSGQFLAGPHLPVAVANTNYPENPMIGQGGDNGWESYTRFPTFPGGSGIVVIESWI